MARRSPEPRHHHHLNNWYRPGEAHPAEAALIHRHNTDTHAHSSMGEVQCPDGCPYRVHDEEA